MRKLLFLPLLLLPACFDGVRDTLLDEAAPRVDTLTVYVPVPVPPDTVYVPVECHFRHRWECKPVPPPWR